MRGHLTASQGSEALWAQAEPHPLVNLPHKESLSCPLLVDCPCQSQPHWKSEKSKLRLAPNNREKTALSKEQGPGGGQAELAPGFWEATGSICYDLAVGTSVFMGHARAKKY